MLQPRIYLVGITTVDVFLGQARLALPDEHAYLPAYKMTPGGSGANMAYSLARLGARVHFCSRVGRDPAGRLARDFLHDAGVDVRSVQFDASQTAFSCIGSDGAGRVGLLHFEGANDSISIDDVRWETLRTCGMLHIGGAMSMRSLDGGKMALLLRTAKQRHDVATSLHTSRNTERKDALLPCLDRLDYLCTNDKEAKAISGRSEVPDAAQWFRDQGVGTVAITMGPSGSYVSAGRISACVPAVPVAAIDTTGCGDAFTAGFVYSALAGRSPLDCARWGNALGSLCARTQGAMPEPFDLEDVLGIVQRLGADSASAAGRDISCAGESRR
jgi:sugar/nucleoside kinase (ribokinase family)